MRICSFNVADIGFLTKRDLARIPQRLERIESWLMGRYDGYCLQENPSLPFGRAPRIRGWSPTRAAGRWNSGLTVGGWVGAFKDEFESAAFRPFGITNANGFVRNRHDRWLAKGFARALIEKNVWLCNTHLDAGRKDASVRRTQLRMISKWLPKPEHGAVILCGDFNPKDKEERQWLRKWARVHGLRQASRNTGMGKDFIFTRGVEVTRSGIDADLSLLSDHPAIWTEIQV